MTIKMRKPETTTKIDKKAFLEGPCFTKMRFLVDLGVLEETQKLLKIYEGFWVKGSWEPSGSHFGWFSAFFSILAPFLVGSGSILGHSGSIF